MALEPSLFILRLNVQLGGCPPMLSQNPLDISHHIIAISTSQVWHPIAVLFLLPFCPLIYLPLKEVNFGKPRRDNSDPLRLPLHLQLS